MTGERLVLEAGDLLAACTRAQGIIANASTLDFNMDEAAYQRLKNVSAAIHQHFLEEMVLLFDTAYQPALKAARQIVDDLRQIIGDES